MYNWLLNLYANLKRFKVILKLCIKRKITNYFKMSIVFAKFQTQILRLKKGGETYLIYIYFF